MANFNHQQGQNPFYVTEEDVREILVSWASSKCCLGTKPAKEMKIKDVQMTRCYNYTMETFTESRSTTNKQEPYDGRFQVDAPINGFTPSAWDVPMRPMAEFKESQSRQEIPHSSVIITCPGCHASGRVKCKVCSGKGSKECKPCGRRYLFQCH